MSEPGPRILSREVVYSGRKVRLEVERVAEPGGREALREVVCHNGSAAILAFRPDGAGGRQLLLERIWRYGVGRRVLEIPAGTLDRADEQPQECARRELAEETGYQAARLRRLLSIWPSPGILSERLTVFVAEDLAPGRCSPEPGEVIETLWVPWAEALRMVHEGEIEDAKTVAAILYYEAFCSKEL